METDHVNMARMSVHGDERTTVQQPGGATCHDVDWRHLSVMGRRDGPPGALLLAFSEAIQSQWQVDRQP